jgi:uncharacterized FAD-dependent dehydrogenase
MNQPDRNLSYDVIVIGGGPAGIFASYELVSQRPALRVALIEQGNTIEQRACSIIEGKSKHCVNCPTCAIMRGFGGAGAFSDGKFNFTTQFGGWLSDYLPDSSVMANIEYVDQVNQRFGATDRFYTTDTAEADLIRQKAIGYDLHLLDARCKHLGTERNRAIIKAQAGFLRDRLDLMCQTEVQQIEPLTTGTDHEPAGYRVATSRGEMDCRFLIAAPGRSGAEWFSEQCRRLKLEQINNQVDIGVRVELPALVFREITDAVYEAKLLYRTKRYKDSVRTFCMNPYGYVVTENTDGILTVNGHSYTDPAMRSDNTNFALLVSNTFTSPFREPYQYGKRIASLSNMLGGGVLIQRFGDLINGQRSNEHRLSQSFVRPTLDATPGDLSLVLPKRHLDNIIEMIMTLDKLAPGTANHDTLLYGVEVKFYSARLQLSAELETQLPGFFAVGDGAGITRGLAQAGASGVIAARSILNRLA